MAKRLCNVLAMACVIGCAGATASAQVFDVVRTAPDLDRYMYPFAPTPGIEQSAPVFGAINQVGFDDRDAQMLLGFDLYADLPTGLDPSRYDVELARVVVYFSTDQRWRYDPTPDSVRSLFNLDDPDYLPDADPGTPVELYGVGYRNGFTDATFLETSPYSPFPPLPPREGVRSAFPAVLNSEGVPTADISRQVRQRFDTTAMALGFNEALSPGQLAPLGESLTFNVDLTDPATRAYFARACATGRLRLMVTTLEPAAGGPGGGAGGLYPAFFTRENPTAAALGLTASLTLRVRVIGCDPDFNQDGNVDQDDVACLAQAVAGDPSCSDADPDFNGDGNVDQDDIDALAQVVAGASCP